MIEISLDQSVPQYRPDDKVAGRVTWSDLDTKITSLETRLIWYTEGKGDQDVGVVETTHVNLTAPNGHANFEFKAPGRPYSFSGKLISLIWAVEVVLFPTRDGERKQLTISGSGQEIVLDQSHEETAL